MPLTEEIQLINIDDELKKLWDEEKGKNRIRACFFNLVIYAEKKRQDEYQKLIESVISKFPCRVILISVDKVGGVYLNANVKTVAVTEEIFCEIIEIDVGGECEKRIPFLVIPHILPDLPLHLLWSVDPSTEKTLLPSLEPYATRIIIDSTHTPNIQNYCKDVLEIIKTVQCNIGDLNWSSLRSLRSLFRSTFDTYENYLKLVNTKLLKIHYTEKNEVRAAYFQGWLASQLNWQFKNFERVEGNIRLSYARPTHEIVVLLVPEKTTDSYPEGVLTSIELESSLDKVCLSMKREKNRVFVQYSDKDKCDLPYCTFLKGMKEGEEIIQEIFYTTGGTHYKNTLSFLSQIPWK